MKKSILILALFISFIGCKKSDDPAPSNLKLTGTTWYGPGSNAGTTATFYNHYSFISDNQVEMYNSYLIGTKTNNYIGTLKYVIDNTSSENPTIKITGKNGFDIAVNETLTYDRSSGRLNNNGTIYTKIK